MIDKQQRTGVRTWIEIDTEAIHGNVKAFRGIIAPQTKLMSVVKSNAYGHGLVDFSKKAVEYGVDWLGVDSIKEGIRLREEGIKVPILVLGYTLPEMISVAAENDISISMSHVSTLEAIQAGTFTRPIKVHIKVDTGMYRQGFIESNKEELFKKLAELKETITVEGLFTHFSTAKNPSFPEYTREQIKRFEGWRVAFIEAGYTPLVHASATSGTILFPEAHYDMVRVGIGLYGLWPSEQTKGFASSRMKLTPILSWKTIVSEFKSLPAGSKISYDGTEILQRPSVVGVCPIGYWHGYPRALSSIGHVLVNGKKAKVLGRVAMDMIIVDLTDCGEIAVGDEVVLIGTQKDAHVTAEYLSYLIEGSWYEFLTRINPLIRKIHF